MPDNVFLRDVTEADLPIFFEQQLDPEATQMAAFPAREREAFMTHWRDNILGNEQGIKKAILWNGRVAGNIVSWQDSDTDDREVGYWLGKEFWGQGIASRALAEFLNYDKTRPLIAHVVSHNIASRRVLEKCGFTKSGILWTFTEDFGEQTDEFWIMELEQ